MSHEYDAENAAYEAKLRDMVLVDVAPNDEFAVIHGGERCGLYDDPLKACDCAEALAKRLGVKWDVTIQARNAADME